VRQSLRELIGAGEYELAAHRLVYGVVRAKLSKPSAIADGRNASRGPGGRVLSTGRGKEVGRG